MVYYCPNYGYTAVDDLNRKSHLPEAIVENGLSEKVQILHNSITNRFRTRRDIVSHVDTQ